MNHRGFTILEALVYTAVTAVILTVAMPTYSRSLHASRELSRNADDIVRVLRAGERWRQDVRNATGPLKASRDELFIPQSSGMVVYRFTDGMVWRDESALLRGVKTSAMQLDRRTRVTLWRWDVELESGRSQPAVRPLFTFEAVP